MTEQTESRAIGFINTIASRCNSCLRRDPQNCRNCLSQWATEIMKSYHADKRAASNHQPDYSMSARMMRIVDMLKKAKDAVPCDKIDLEGLCTPQLKQYTLKVMMRKGIIGRRRMTTPMNGNTQYGYFLADSTRLPRL